MGWNLVYAALLVLASPMIAYRRVRHGRYRRGWRNKLCGIGPVDPPQPGCRWFHAVSVGEVNLLAGLIQRLEQSGDTRPWIVTTSTDTGYDLAVQRFGMERVQFAPLDWSWAVRKTLRLLQCNYGFLVGQSKPA